MNIASKLKNIDVDRVLKRVGLRRRSSAGSWIIPSITLLGVGVIVGAGLGLLFAPSSGRSLREKLQGKVAKVTDALDSARKPANGQRADSF